MMPAWAAYQAPSLAVSPGLSTELKLLNPDFAVAVGIDQRSGSLPHPRGRARGVFHAAGWRGRSGGAALVLVFLRFPAVDHNYDR
jgi:hypothetical protein